mgnify:FL=1
MSAAVIALLAVSLVTGAPVARNVLFRSPLVHVPMIALMKAPGVLFVVYLLVAKCPRCSALPIRDEAFGGEASGTCGRCCLTT